MSEEKMIDISGLPKAAVLAALYNRARVLGMGALHFIPGDMSEEQAQAIVDEKVVLPDYLGSTRGSPSGARLYFDYLYGRVMKADISGDEFSPWGYDRDNGAGAAEAVIEALREEANDER